MLKRRSEIIVILSVKGHAYILLRSSFGNTPLSFRGVLVMVSADAMRSTLATTALIPDWAAMSWMRLTVMPLIMESGSQSVGEHATSITVASLKDWTVEGAAYVKMRLTEWVQNEGALGTRFAKMPEEGFAAFHADLKRLLKDALTQQTAHLKRTVSLPLDTVQRMILLQHAANDLGILFNFYTDIETRTHLFNVYAVVDDFEFDVDVLMRTPPEVLNPIMDERRTLIKTQESAHNLGREMSIEFFLNLGQDVDMFHVWKAFVSINAGLSEASIDSVVSLFNDLPADTGVLRLERNSATGEFSFLFGSDGQLHTMLEHMESRANQGASEATDCMGPGVANQDGTEETDPIDVTDLDHAKSDVNLDGMD